MNTERSSREQHRPLSAVEIEALRELEAKATKAPWVPDDMAGPKAPYLCHKGAEGRPIVGRFDYNAPADMPLIAAMRNALPRLLSMLQPPTDAAVRDAVEYIDDILHYYPDDMEPKFVESKHLRTLLTALREAQQQNSEQALNIVTMTHMHDALRKSVEMQAEVVMALRVALSAAIGRCEGGK